MTTFTYPIDDRLSLAFPQLNAAEKLFALIESDRVHIEAFIDVIAETKTLEDEKDFIKMKLHGYAEGTDYLFFIMYDETICGCIDIHNIEPKNRQRRDRLLVAFFLYQTRHCYKLRSSALQIGLQRLRIKQALDLC